MKNGKIVGIRSAVSKSGNPYKYAFYTYKDEKDADTVGDKVGSAFLSDEIVKAIGTKNPIGLAITIGGRYDKNGNWNDVISSVKA